MAFLAVVAAVPRAWLVANRVDVGGDGPTRAMWAYVWARIPVLVTHGMWLPGVTYVAGPLTFVLASPLLATRLVSLACGVASVPLLFALVRRAHGTGPALIAALLLAFLPLHVELSATALSEIPAMCAVLAAAILVVSAEDSRRPNLTRMGMILCASWAALVRYETWPLLPLFAISAGVRGGLRAGVGCAALLAIVPVMWTIGNYHATADPFFGLTMALRGAAIEGGGPVAFGTALHMLGHGAVSELGWILSGAVVLGVMVVIHPGIRSTPASGVLLALSAIECALVAAFASRRGASMQPRYLLGVLVLALPFVARGFATLGSSRTAIVATIVLALGLAEPWSRPWHYLVADVPADIRGVVGWLRESPYSDREILLTSLNWKASYFAVEWPVMVARTHILSPWMSDAELSGIIKDSPPTLLITSAEDDDLLARVERAMGRSISTRAVVESVGDLRVYDLGRIASDLPGR